MTAKHIIISGASTGLGRELALSYAKPKITLGLIARDLEKLKAVATLCQQQGALVEILSCDLSCEFNKLKQWLYIFQQNYPIDLVIANAGITASTSPQRQLESWQQTQKLIETNVLGVMSLIHPIVEWMQQQQAGQIAIISSIGAYYGMPVTPSYCASKSAIKTYAEGLRGLLYQDNIQVSIIYPGFIKTAMSDQFPAPKPFLMSAHKAAKIIKKGLNKRKKTIAFPFLLSLGMSFLPLLPSALSDLILRNYRNKP